MAEEVGVGFVRLVPSMRGFAKAAERQMSRGLAGPARRAGEDAGDEIGDGVDEKLGRRAIGIGKGFAPGVR